MWSNFVQYSYTWSRIGKPHYNDYFSIQHSPNVFGNAARQQVSLHSLLTSQLGLVTSSQLHTPAALPPAQNRYSLNKRLVGVHSASGRFNPFQPKLILVHTTVTGTCRRAYKTCKNWPLCSYVGWHQHSQPNTEKSAQCAKMTTGAIGQKAFILRTDEKHDAIWHHGAGKG